MNRPKISISIDASLLTQIDLIAERRDEPRSEVIERILRNGMSVEQDNIRAMEHPIVGGLMKWLTEHPTALRMVATTLGEQISPEEMKKYTQLPAKIERVRKQAKGRKVGA